MAGPAKWICVLSASYFQSALPRVDHYKLLYNNPAPCTSLEHNWWYSPKSFCFFILFSLNSTSLLKLVSNLAKELLRTFQAHNRTADRQHPVVYWPDTSRMWPTTWLKKGQTRFPHLNGCIPYHTSWAFIALPLSLACEWGEQVTNNLCSSFLRTFCLLLLSLGNRWCG